MRTFDDGAGDSLYVGGSFTGVFGGPTVLRRLAAWNGSSWVEVGGGLSSGQVNTLQVFDDGTGEALYVWGLFSNPGGSGAVNLARWDGTTWAGLGVFDDIVHALAVFDDGSGECLYALGEFSTIGAQSLNRIARWDGSNWSQVGEALDSGMPYAICTFDDGAGPALYVGGQSMTFGGVALGTLVRWDGTAWTAVGGGTDNTVRALATFDDGGGDALFVGGSFSHAGVVTANDIARWDGSSWDSLGGGTSGSVSSLFSYDDGHGAALYIGGSFNKCSGVDAKSIAKWDGLNWEPLGSGASGGGTVKTMAAFDAGGGAQLYAGGNFTIMGDIAGTRCIAALFPGFQDCDRNGLDDSCEIAEDADLDHDANNQLATCQIQVDPSLDCNSNGVLDSWEIGQDASIDCNSNSILDICEYSIDIVYIVDTSGSMDVESDALCDAIGPVQDELEARGYLVRTTIWGIETTPIDGWECLTDNVNNVLGGTLQGEDWAPACAVVAEEFDWAAGIRLVIPVSDEGPVGDANPCGDSEAAEEIDAAIIAAVANDVIVSPLIGCPVVGTVTDCDYIGRDCTIEFAEELAAGTGGVAVTTDDPHTDIADDDLLLNLILSAISGSLQDVDGEGGPDECEACRVDVNNDAIVDFFDMQTFLNAYAASEPLADWNFDGQYDFFDTQAFLNDYSAGCP